MDEMSLEELVVTVDPCPESLCRVARRLYRALDAKGDEPGSSASVELISYFFEETARAAVEWMAAGDVEKVDQLTSSLRLMLREEGADLGILDTLPSAQPLTCRVEVLTHFTAVYLRTDNSPKLAGLLASSKRTESWHRALRWIAEQGRAIQVPELVRAGLFNNRETARRALDAMMERYRLLDKSKEPGRQPALYELSSTGHKWWRVVRQLSENRLTPSQESQTAVQASSTTAPNSTDKDYFPIARPKGYAEWASS